MAKLFKHLKENWIKYGFETLTILAGIIGALTIDNWNEERKERVQEHSILKQLQGDFETNQRLIEAGIVRYQGIDKIIRLTINHTGPEVDLPEPEVLDSLKMLNYVRVELVHGTINLILSADQMELLTNDILTARLAAFPGENSIYKSYELLSIDIALRQRELHKSYIAVLSLRPGLQTGAQIQHESDFLGLLRTRNHQNLAVDRFIQNSNAYKALLNLKESNQSILDMINSELSRFR